MDITNTHTTATLELKSHAPCSVLQEAHALVTQQGNIASISAIPSVASLRGKQNRLQNEKNKHDKSLVFNATAVTSTLTTTTIVNTPATDLSLPPPTPNLSVSGPTADVSLLGCLLPAPPPFATANIRATSTSPLHSSSDPIPPAGLTPAPCPSDFDSDTELSIVAAAAATTAANAVTAIKDHSTTPPVLSVSGSSCPPVQTELVAMTNGHLNSSNNTSSSSELSLNSKQQRQQKRRRERAQRLQAERDSRCNSSALSASLVGESVGVGVSLGIVNAAGGSSGSMIGTVTAPSILMGNSSVLGPGNGMLYHLNSAGSMGEDSNNSNGNFTSSSNGSNNLLPPTDSIASLLLNPPHSPECISGLMATPSDSEGESLDEDLLSTSSSSTLLLPRDKPPPRPPPPVRRKLPRSPVLEEEIIDGFAILEFKTYEDLEFAIKLGQKRKEKRLSALEELTCTYSIEEMKMPKIIDTGQQHLHTLRATSLNSLSVVSNNNLKEIHHHQHRCVGVGTGGTIVATTNSSSINNNTSNDSNCSTVYSVPLTSICNAPDLEVDVNWAGDQYRQQQDQLSAGSASNNISNSNTNIGMKSNANQNQFEHINHTIQSKQCESSVSTDNNTTITGSINTAIGSCLLENGNEQLNLDITRPTLLSVGLVVPHMGINIISGNENGSGSTVDKSKNSICNDNQENCLVTDYISIKSTKSTDAAAVNNHLSAMRSSSSCPKIKKLNSIETNDADIVTTAAVGRSTGLALEIRDFANGSSAQIVGTSILLKNDNDLNENFTDISDNCSSINKETNICDKPNGDNKNTESLIAFVFPSTHSSDSPRQATTQNSSEYSQPQTIRTECASGDNVMTSSTVLSTPETRPVLNPLNATGSNGSLAVVNENGSSPSLCMQKFVGIVPPTIVTDDVDNQQSKSVTDNVLQTKLSHPAVSSSGKVTGVSISVGCDSQLISTAGQCGIALTSSANAQGIILSGKIVSTQGMEVPAVRPTVPLLAGTPLTPVTMAPLHGVSLVDRSSSVLLAAGMKSNDNVMLSIEGGKSTTAPGDAQKSTIGSFQTPTPVANGFRTGYSPVSCTTTSAVGSALPHVSPHLGSKLLSVSMTLPANTAANPVAVAACGITKTSFSTGTIPVGSVGPSLVFHGAPPPIPQLGASLPMLIQATPYRNSYANYSLYTPYNSIAHGQYLPSVLPIVTSSTSSSPHRSDTRSCRESQVTSTPKAPVTSGTTSQNNSVCGISALRPITPLGYVVSNNNSTQAVAVVTTTTTTVPLINATHPHHLPVYTAGAFGVSTTGPTITTASHSTPAVTSVAATSQLIPAAPTQTVPQSGYSAHLPRLLTTYSQFATPAPTQQQSLLRCSTTSTMSTSNTSVLTVQSLTTKLPPSSMPASIASASSVIQKVFSPKSECSSSRDRDTSYSITTVRPNNSALMTGGAQGVTLGQQFCGIGPSTPYSGVSVSSSNTLSSATHTVLAVAGPSMATFSPKTGLWLNTSVVPTAAMTCTSSVPMVSNGNVRPSPLSLNSGVAGTPTRVVGNAVSPLALPSTVGSGHVPVANFQPTFFATPLIPPHSSSATPISLTSISNSSVGHLPLVSHTSAVIATMTTATTTTSSVSTVGNTQSTVATVSTAVTPTPHPFSAESLFQPSKNDQADLLRRELDSRFLDRSGLSQPPPTSSATYLRQELHHHQHQHTHLHQHPQLLSTAPMSAANTALPPTPPNSTQIFPPPLFKDIPKITAVDPQFYRAGIGLPPGYTGYSSAGLLHAGLGGPTPFMPPNHLTSFAPKKTGRWNAMHVRIAWEIYYHQNKQNSEKNVCAASVVGTNLNSTSISVNSVISGTTGSAINIISGTASGGGGSGISENSIAASVATGNVVTASGCAAAFGMKPSSSMTLNTTSPHLLHRSGELTSAATYSRSPFETSPLAASFIGAPPSHIGTAVSPFGRYVGSFGFAGLTHFGRDISLTGHLDAWRTSSMPRSVSYHPAATAGPSGWSMKPDPAMENARREAEEREREREIREREQRERDRQRREREERERERKEKEEKLKREQQERERERERKERERREIERREIERERMLQQQRINESNKQAAAAASSSTSRDRSPHRNIIEHSPEIRIKEEHPRTKEEQDVMLMRASAAAVGDPRYHPSSLVAVQANAVAAAHHHVNFMVTGRHGPPHGLPPTASHLSRNMMPPTLGVGGALTHFAPPVPSAWGIDPYRDPYAPILRYNPIMEAAFRHEAEERQKALSMYAAQSAAHLRGKEPSPIPPPSVGSLGPPPTHLRMQPPLGVVAIAPSSVPQPSQPPQTQLTQIGMVKAPGLPTPTMSMSVQHMITVDTLSHPAVITKKEPDHTIGIVVSAPGTGIGHNTIPGSVIGMQPAPPVTPSR